MKEEKKIFVVSVVLAQVDGMQIRKMVHSLLMLFLSVLPVFCQRARPLPVSGIGESVHTPFSKKISTEFSLCCLRYPCRRAYQWQPAASFGLGSEKMVRKKNSNNELFYGRKAWLGSLRIAAAIAPLGSAHTVLMQTKHRQPRRRSADKLKQMLQHIAVQAAT